MVCDWVSSHARSTCGPHLARRRRIVMWPVFHHATGQVAVGRQLTQHGLAAVETVSDRVKTSVVLVFAQQAENLDGLLRPPAGGHRADTTSLRPVGGREYVVYLTSSTKQNWYEITSPWLIVPQDCFERGQRDQESLVEQVGDQVKKRRSIGRSRRGKTAGRSCSRPTKRGTSLRGSLSSKERS